MSRMAVSTTTLKWIVSMKKRLVVLFSGIISNEVTILINHKLLDVRTLIVVL